MWKIDTRIMLRHPLCGGGIGNFAGAFGEEQARYFASEERPKAETQVAGCPEAGFNEFLQTGAETGAVGLVLLLLITGSAIVSQLRRGAPFGYGLLAAAVFACFSYPWGVLPLRLLFVVLLAGTCSKRVVPIPGRGHVVVLLALAGCLVCWTGLYSLLCPSCGSPAAMERDPHLAEFRTVRLPGRRRAPLPRRSAGRLSVFIRLRLCAAQNGQLPAKQ